MKTLNICWGVFVLAATVALARPVMSPERLGTVNTASGDSSQTDFGVPGLDTRFVGDDLAGTNNEQKSSWTARVGTNIFLQPTTTKQPFLDLTTLNGHKSLLFSGSNSMTAGHVLNQSTNDWTYFVVGNFGTGAYQTLLGKGYSGPTSNMWAIYKDTSANGLYNFSYQKTSQPTVTFSPATNAVQVYTYQVSQTGGMHRILIDGVCVATGTFTPSTNDNQLAANLRIGAWGTTQDTNTQLFLSGRIGDVPIWNRWLSESEISNVTYGLSQTYATPYSQFRDFNPTTVTSAVLRMWVDVTQLSATNGQSFGSVSDISGSGILFTNSNASAQPTYTTNCLNGRPALVFDTTDDRLQSTNVSLSAERTIFMAMAFSQAASIPFMQNDGVIYDEIYTASATLYGYGGPSADIATSYSIFPYGKCYIVEARFSPTGSKIWLNGNLLPGGTVGGPSTNAITGPLQFGYRDSTYKGCTIGDVKVFIGVPSDADRSNIVGNLRWKFGVN